MKYSCRIFLIAVFAAVLTSCVNVRVVSGHRKSPTMNRTIAKSENAPVIVAVPNGELDRLPPEESTKKAASKIKEICGGDFELISEGAQHVDNGLILLPLPIFGVLFGQSGYNEYQWTASCVPQPAPTVSTALPTSP
jgi:hypothetical protein